MRKVDDLLRESLGGEVPPEVDGRLGERLDRFLAERRREAAGQAHGGTLLGRIADLALSLLASRAAAPVAVAVLLAGISLQWLGASSPATGPLPRLGATVSLSWEIRHAEAPVCEGGGALGELAPEALSGRVYRDWALVRREGSASAGARLLFRALDEPAYYEMETEPGSFRPRRLRRLALLPSQAPGAPVDACEWPPSEAGAGPEGRSR